MVAFNPPRDRDAWAVIRGFVYQVDLTIRRWLDLAPGEVLELERGEDIDLVSSALLASEGEGSRLLEQVKHRERPVTLLSQPAVCAVACALEHRRSNPQLDLRFRFTTNARVTRERFGGHPRPGIELWEELRLGRIAGESLPGTVAAIRSLLAAATQPATLNVEAWAAFRAAIEDPSDAGLLDIIRRFEWGTRSEAALSLGASLTQALVTSGRASDLTEARALYERLFLHVFKTLSRDGIKRLTGPDLAGLLALPTLADSDRSLLERVVLRLLDIEGRLDRVEREGAALLVQIDGRVRELAREQRVLASVEFAAEDLDLEVPAPCLHASPRTGDVDAIRGSVADHAWTAIHGGSSTGKTQLAALVARPSTPRVWVRLRDLGTGQAARRVDLALESASGVACRSGRRSHYRDALGRLGRGALIVLDDLPRLEVGDGLSERLLRLAAAAHGSEGRLLTTSCYPLPSRVLDSAPPGTIHALAMPPFGEEDARALLLSLGAPGPWLAGRFVAHLNNLARRHPLLLDAIGRYLARKRWSYRDEEWDDLLAGRHAREVTRETIGRLIHTVEDPSSRELLYRLSLVIGGFSEEDVVALASVAPALDRPRERLDSILGPWVQSGRPGQLYLSPLVGSVGGDELARPVRRRCLLRLGSRVIRRRKLGPEDLCDAVTYFAGARAFDRAGLLLIQALSHLNSLERQVEPRLVLSLWYGVPLPGKMNLGLRLYLRALQYRVRARYGRPVDGLLGDVDRLSRLATEADAWAVLGAAVLLRGQLDEANRILGICLLHRAFRLATDFRMFAGRPLDWPGEVGPEWMIWSVAGDLSGEAELAEWKAAVEALGPEGRRRAFGHESAELGCTVVAGVLNRAELSKPAGERRWDRVLGCVDELAAWAQGLGIGLLWASFLRARLIIMGEHLGRTQEVVSAAAEALDGAPDDPRVRFLLSDSIGEFLLRDGRPGEALEWLERALASGAGCYALEHLLVLVNASRATATSAPERSQAFLREAERRVSEDETLPDVEAARVLGEIAIGEGLGGHLPQCFRALEEGVERLLNCKEDSARWRSLFVLFGHTSGYFTSLSFRGSPPDSTREGDAYAAPVRGWFYGHDEDLAGHYDGSRVYAIALQLAIFADALGDDPRASAWAAKALDRAPAAGRQAAVQEVTRRFVPQLLIDGRYAEAMEAALGYGATLMARSMVQQPAGLELPDDFDVARALGERPNPNWQQAERWAALSGLIPAAVRLAHLAIERPDEASQAAREVVSVCRQIGAGAADPGLWELLSDIVERALVQPIGARAYRAMTEELDSSAMGPAKMIAALLLSVHPGVTPEEALALHLSILPALEQYLDRPFGTYRRILVPFLTSYWAERFRLMRFRFLRPSLVEQALSAAVDTPPDRRIVAVIGAILIGIPMRLPPDIRAWLDAS